MTKVAVFTRLPVIDALRKAAPRAEFIEVGKDRLPYEAAAGAEVAFGMGFDARIAQEFLDAVPSVKWLMTYTAGSEFYFEGGIIQRPGLTVTNNAAQGSVLGEHTMGLIYAAAKNLYPHAQAQKEHRWGGGAGGQMRNIDLGHSTLVVYGMGLIGGDLARLAAGNRMRVLGIRRTGGTPPPGVERVGTSADLLAFAAEADFFAIVTPLTPETRGSIDAKVIARLRPTAWLVNVARGPVVVEADLLAALREKRIAGAALDVFDREPLPADHPFWDLDNVIITPHTGGTSPRAIERTAEAFAENLARFERGEPLTRVVNPKAGY